MGKDKILHLNLKRKWFDMVASGEKMEEYRDIREYWISRLMNFSDNYKSYFLSVMDMLIYEIKKGVMSSDECIHHYGLSFKDFDYIVFSNGYRKDRLQIKVELKNIKIAEGQADWGAETGIKYFVLELGEIIK